MNTIEEILTECKKSVDSWVSNPNDFANYCNGQLAYAAAAYAVSSTMTTDEMRSHSDLIDRIWPWNQESFRPERPRNDLIFAAALIVAEIERLDRIDVDAPLPAAIAPVPSERKLSASQNDALKKLAAVNDWAIPHQMAVSEAMMAQLAKIGLAECRHISGWTRWRITETGRDTAEICDRTIERHP